MKFGNESMDDKAGQPDNPSRRSFLKKLGGVAVAAMGIDNLAKSEVDLQASASVENKFINKDGKCEFMFTSEDPEKAHDSANVFQKEVGDALKAVYPSRILDPNVTLQMFRINGQKFYRMTWSCRIVKSKETDADYYFDRRGTFKPGKTLAEAKREVESELNRSGKVNEMRRRWKGRGTIYPTFIKEASAGSEAEGYWHLKEFFMVIPK